MEDSLEVLELNRFVTANNEQGYELDYQINQKKFMKKIVKIPK